MDEASPVSDFITRIFHPVLAPVITPINEMLAATYEPWATIFAIGLFFSGVVFVFSLRKEYIALDAPGPGLRYDLRFWTVVCIIPYIAAYLYFKKWS